MSREERLQQLTTEYQEEFEQLFEQREQLEVEQMKRMIALGSLITLLKSVEDITTIL